MGVVVAIIQFFGELADHLSPESRDRPLSRETAVPGSVKDWIESFGVPHTEVGRVVVGEEPVEFSYLVRDGDRISVYPRERLEGERFVLDVHLGKLAAYLRMMGFDTVYRNCFDDPELVRIAVEQDRALLTRDRGLLKHAALTRGYWLRATDSRRQLEEVIRRFALAGRTRPFTRCMACNGVLEEVGRAEAAAKVPTRVAAEFQEFRGCRECGRIYWRGSHYRRMREWIEGF
jgi:uncharacterized protein with PIN domain